MKRQAWKFRLAFNPYRGMEGEFEGRAGESFSPGPPLNYPHYYLYRPATFMRTRERRMAASARV
jgi:hypothetical protein